MKEQKIMLNDLFTWQDVINFSENNYRFGFEILERIILKDFRPDTIINRIKSYIYNQIINRFPDFPFKEDFFNYRFIIKENENKKMVLSLDSSSILCEIIYNSSNRYLDKCSLEKIKNVCELNSKEGIIDELKKNMSGINNNLNDDYVMGYNPQSKSRLSKEEYKNALLAKRKMNIWTIRHYDELYSFLNEPFNLEMFNGISKDKFLLTSISFSLKQSSILDPKISNYNLDSLNCINNYLLLINYINEENSASYCESFNSNLSDGSILTISSQTIRKLFTKFFSNHPDILGKCSFATSYEEILKIHAQETWKRIQSEKHARNIKLNFEMIQSGKKINLSNYQKNGFVRISSNSKKRKAKLKRDYDLLEEKMEYFSHTNPSMELVGINTFTGYTAYMYSNGVVVLEKLYKRINKDSLGKEIIVPTSDEAIYVMNYVEFADLSKYTKMELIQEISDFNNPNVKRIYHTPNGSWKDKVDKLIAGPGYGDLDYELFDDLISNLADNPKQLVKE